MTSDAQPCVAIIGGSGLYGLEQLEVEGEQWVETPFGRPSDAVRLGRLGGVRLLFLARHGRQHELPPRLVNFRANVHALKQLGAQQILSVSAVGSLREHMHPGDVVFVDQCIDQTRGRESSFFADAGLVAHVSLADPVDAALQAHLAVHAQRLGMAHHSQGTYVCIEGPQFSTRAESELYRRWGADVIGMTMATEAKLAREAELPFASIAMVTDYDCWHVSEADVSVEAVLAVLRQTSARVQTLLQAAVRDLPDPTQSPSTHALRDALIGDVAALPEALQARFAGLLRRQRR
ncbi:MAG: S-methyl-5'-thioadenosine phosphorylase [Polyangiales bacterium]